MKTTHKIVYGTLISLASLGSFDNIYSQLSHPASPIYMGRHTHNTKGDSTKKNLDSLVVKEDNTSKRLRPIAITLMFLAGLGAVAVSVAGLSYILSRSKKS